MNLDSVPEPYFLCPELGFSLQALLALLIGWEVLEGSKAQADCL